MFCMPKSNVYDAPRSFVTRFLVKHRTLVIDLGTPRRVLSSAPRRGGLVTACSIINHQVSDAPRHDHRWSRDPARYLGFVARELGARAPCVGLMTAVPMHQLIVLREWSEGLWVEGFLTVGVSNAVRAGDPCGPPAVSPGPGTINIIIVTNGALSASAMATAIQVITESKTASLLAHAVRSSTGDPGATGTGTDAVAVVSGVEIPLRYSGTHTAIGQLMGRLVTRGLSHGLRMCLDPHQPPNRAAWRPGG